jgi:hypothetical protein
MAEASRAAVCARDANLKRCASNLAWILTSLVLFAGILDATALLELSDSFILAFWVAVPLGLAALWLYSLAGQPIVTSGAAMLLGAVLLIAFWLPPTIEMTLGVVSPEIVLKQDIARTVLVSYFLILQSLVLTSGDSIRCARILRGFLIFYIGYGLFDFCGQLLGWPGLLDFMRLGATTFARGAQGWLSIPRVMSLSAEPSLTLLPILLTLYLAIFFPMRRWPRRLLLLATFAFALLTISRTVWVVVLACLLVCTAAHQLWRNRALRPWLEASPILVMILVSIQFSLSASTVASGFTDESASIRAATTQMGLRIFGDYPWLGIGPNNFGHVFAQYSSGLFDPLAAAKSNINSGLAYYLQGYGIAGFAIYFLPMLLIAAMKNVPLSARLGWVTAFSIAGTLTDIYYLPHAALVLAVLVAENAASAVRNTGRRTTRDAANLFRPQQI